MRIVLSICIFAVMFISSGVDASERSKTGISIDDSRSVTFRYITESGNAFDIGARFGKSHYKSGSFDYHRDESYAQAVLGYRKYRYDEKMNQFYGVSLISTYRTTHTESPSGDFRQVILDINLGMEYMLSADVSIEGRVGFGVNYYDYASNSSHARNFILPTTGVAVNYYW